MTNSVIMETKRGSVPGVAARASGRPSSLARWAASTSRSCTTSMWSVMNPTGTSTAPGAPAAASPVRWSHTSGPSHGWLGGPLRLW